MTTPDQTGFVGMVFHYALVSAFLMGALMVFLFFWKRGGLGFDEESKMTMMEGEESDGKRN